MLHPGKRGHPHGGIAFLGAGGMQRVVVKRRAAVREKATEAARHDCPQLLLLQPRAALSAFSASSE